MKCNTMEDLRREVATRLRNSLHGREIDMLEGVRPRLPHMLGITPLNKVHDPKNEEGTLLDTTHHFWQDWHEPIDTKAEVQRKLETAIASLAEEDVFRVTYPHGKDAEIAYVEVDELHPAETVLQTSCRECDSTISTAPSLSEDNGQYYIKVSLDCPECDFSGVFERGLFQA